jgi:hypothetical protein
MAEPTHRRAIVNSPTVIDLGPDLGGETSVRFDTNRLIEIELELDDLLDKHNARLEQRGEEPFESVWEALEELTERYPMVTIRVLLRAAFPDLEEIPLALLNDPKIGDALSAAIAVAFGQDPAELPQEETTSTDPTVAGGDAGASTGGPSTPSGPVPSRAEA